MFYNHTIDGGMVTNRPNFGFKGLIGGTESATNKVSKKKNF